ncbi:hypothetical protein [Pedobacter insulae]|uniref:Uncharacterized protein n=1 Tax=Pedobacter insulae TaxID=414048 RepID=A0A1I2ZGW6_9SPHI|nr:hypothetical protein [Pedobacter insulae]SFH36970.1 hypothetical protein SAMN04489864_11015 [Pedobacter insulae]
MSNLGLNTNLFRVTGKYLDILSEFIVRVKINSEVSEQKKEQLIDLLKKINDIENTQPQIQLLSSIIERELRHDQKKLSVYIKSLITELEENKVNAALPKIEFIAEILDGENSEALSKMKGD